MVAMNVRHDRIARVQARMRDEGLIAIVVMNHDDYRYLFGTDRSQPRAIIPAQGPPALIAFSGEEPELRAALPDGQVRVFGSVGGQIHDVVTHLRELMVSQPGALEMAGPPQASAVTDAAPRARPKVGMQLWFETPAFLVEMFRRVNPGVELVSSDPVMDPLRMVKDEGEIATLREAQRVAALGMDRARELLRPGATARDIATEVLYAMLKAGAEGTATPIYINVGIESCMLHGRSSPEPMRRGQFVVIDLTPRVDGYGANLARTFMLGEPDARQAELLATYAEVIEAARPNLRPGTTVADLDAVGRATCERHGFGELYVDGLGHGVGLRFEETPASTIIPAHRRVPLLEGMTVTIGHPVLAIPGFGGVRFEDVYRVTPDGGDPLWPYPIAPVVHV
jgi:Xaa-Pro aminopeptidase